MSSKKKGNSKGSFRNPLRYQSLTISVPPSLPQKSLRRSSLRVSSSPPNDIFTEYITASSPTTSAGSDGRLSLYSVSDYGDDNDSLSSPMARYGEGEDGVTTGLGHEDAKLVYRRINSSRRQSRQLALEALQTSFDIAEKSA